MRIFAASLATETNSFSPIPTSRESYENTLYFPPGKHPDRGTLCTGPLWVARRLPGVGGCIAGEHPVENLSGAALLLGGEGGQ